MRRVLCLALVACAPALAFAVDPAFPASEQEEIRLAAETWNAVTVPEKRISVEGGQWTVQAIAPEGGWNGITYRSRRVIQIHPQHPRATVYAVAMHEFGHALGLAHLCTSNAVGPESSDRVCDVTASVGVMDPLTVREDLTALDMAECRRVGSCP